MSKLKKKPPTWAVMKITYGVGALLLAVLGAFGILSEVQVNQWTSELDKILSYAIGVLGLTTAWARTNPGSASSVTAADVAAAATPDMSGITDQVRDAAERAVRDTLSRIPGADQTAQAVLAAIRAEEKGEHDTAAGTAATAEASTDYVYGR